MSNKNTNTKDLKEMLTAFNKDVDGVTIPLEVHSYSQTAMDVQSLINVSRTALVTLIQLPSPDNCDLNEIHNCLSLANSILDRLSYDIEILDKI